MTRDRIVLHRSYLPGVIATEASTDLVFARHSHEEFGVGIICAGAQRSASGRGPVEAGTGDVITVNPGEVHDGAPLGDRRAWRMLYFGPALVHGAADEFGLAAPRHIELCRPVIQDAKLSRLVSRAFAVVIDPCADPESREAALLLLLERLLHHHASSAPRSRSCISASVARARQRIDDDPSRNESLAELAAEAGLSRFRLLRAFARETGLTPQAYRRVRRVLLARTLIRAGRDLAETAAAVGFVDQSHMNRAFLRVTGATPGAWSRVLR